jgi:hypothetical protein
MGVFLKMYSRYVGICRYDDETVFAGVTRVS